MLVRFSPPTGSPWTPALICMKLAAITYLWNAFGIVIILYLQLFDPLVPQQHSMCSQGPPGIPGMNGLNGNNGSPGTMGEKGVAGPTGPRGFKGEAGVKGETGVAGPPGPRGAKGEVGPSAKASQQKNWKQCAWKTVDGRDTGVIKVYCKQTLLLRPRYVK